YDRSAAPVGFSSKWKLTQDSSLLHQDVLKALPNVPWVDHTRVAAFGFRFGANVAVRLAYLESPRLKAVACLGPVVHTLLSDFKCQQQVPEMYLDVLASRLGMH
ncbi:alpha/beta hydrolase, partial [Pseudomonas aeruginosa]|uniref:alpha/beta hydrolase n=1 Tax=Pseudomonas aeruginosa TaxID=287 RepID=UPI0031B6795D